VYVGGPPAQAFNVAVDNPVVGCVLGRPTARAVTGAGVVIGKPCLPEAIPHGVDVEVAIERPVGGAKQGGIGEAGGRG
jgi:hypothetical protein